MDGWMHGCMDGWMDACMDGCMHACMGHARSTSSKAERRATVLEAHAAGDDPAAGTPVCRQLEAEICVYIYI